MRTKILLNGLFRVGIWVMAVVSADAQTFTAEIDHDPISLNEPVLLNITISNPRSEPFDLDLGADGKENIQLIVSSLQGLQTQKPKPRAQDSSTFSGRVNIPPGGFYTKVLVLNEWFQFKQPGKYQITVVVQDARNEKRPLFKPMTIVLSIEARDGERLSAECKRLLEQVQNSSGAEARIAAASALGYVHDAVAVPYLQHMAQRNDVGLFGIAGLAHIGNREAVEALIATLQVSDPTTRSRARAVLKHIALATDDESIQTLIREAIR
jgi:hypothetical protein